MSNLSLIPDPSRYGAQLQRKQRALDDIFGQFQRPPIEVFPSPPRHYRQRAEFKIWHHNDSASYAMFPDGNKNKPQFLRDFAIACESIHQLMPPLMAAINDEPVLKRKLFQMEFLSTLAGQTLVTMVYHRSLDSDWESAAIALQAEFNIKIVGRSRRQKVVLSQDYVEESLTLIDPALGERRFDYKQLEGCFSQPNAAVCIHMLNWASAAAGSIQTDPPTDLLELYCGNGNFTLPLSRFFERVLATEISKPLTRAAIDNCTTNRITNIEFARLSAEEVTQALNREREFRRLRHLDLDSFNFSTVFVDPPRAGLDDATNRLVQRFDNILYVSCNPHTLADNLTQLSATHGIERMALFDQFPYTDHMECGVLLKKQ